MYSTLNATILNTMASLRALVIGDAMLDSYLHGAAGRICREAPVPVVTLAQRMDVPGGAANVAANVRALGAHPTLLCALGDDPEGAALCHALKACGVVCDRIVIQPGRASMVKSRVLADAQMLVRFDQGDGGPLGEEAERQLIEQMHECYPASDLVIISDYGYGVLSPRVRAALATLQRRYPRVLAVDSKDLALFRDMGVTLVKPNYSEQLALLGAQEMPAPRVDAIAVRADQLLAVTGAQIVAATLDADGALLIERDTTPRRLLAQHVANPHTAGAGDTFITTMALALAAGTTTEVAGELAALAAGVVVEGEDTALCTAAALRERLGAAPGPFDLDELVARIEGYRAAGRCVVFTNGCFDILHPGHVTFLNQARALGDVLIVGVNTDASISRLKGQGRPINTLDDRVQVLAALSCVDHIIALEDDTPHALISALRPDVFAKGGNYSRAELPEAELVEELGGRVQLLPYIEERSTTRLIERIRGSAIVELAREAGR
jgi:D-beta-D-heptose 7-phosphate kinase / D-beta-D-heptose 1-phosphate adenosyltransferase